MDEPEGFSRFWAAYPRRVAKGEARKAWTKLKPDAALLETMLKALEWQRKEWDDPRYIPHPATWIRAERYADERYTPTVSVQSLDWRFECQQLHGSRCGNVHFHLAKVAHDKEQAS